MTSRGCQCSGRLGCSAPTRRQGRWGCWCRHPRCYGAAPAGHAAGGPGRRRRRDPHSPLRRLRPCHGLLLRRVLRVGPRPRQPLGTRPAHSPVHFLRPQARSMPLLPENGVGSPSAPPVIRSSMGCGFPFECNEGMEGERKAPAVRELVSSNRGAASS